MVTIVPITDHQEYEVNGKVVYLHSSGEWMSRQELTTQEHTAFRVYRKNVIYNKAFKKHTKATYGKK